MNKQSSKGLILKAGLFMACALAPMLSVEPVAIAAPDAFKAELRIIAPIPGDSTAQHLPGTIIRQNSKWSLSFGIVSQQATATSLLKAVEVDMPLRRVALSDPGTGVQDLDFERLGQAKFSEFATKLEALGGFVLVGDRLKQEARFVRNGIYQGQKIQVYSFKESKDVFGQIFYSPELGIPLKIDTYDAGKGQRTFIEVGLTK